MFRDAWQWLWRGGRASLGWPPENLYEELYGRPGGSSPDDSASGEGDFRLIGRIELSLLFMEGLQRSDTVVDFGCGSGRLATHLVPALRDGHYIGIDISQAMLDRARARIDRIVPSPGCRVTWRRQTACPFPLADRSIDMMCAFSVFTHMEHEDTYRYLKDALRVVRPHGSFILSCLPMDLPAAQQVFLDSAADSFAARWSRVRNVTTSTDLMSAIATLAGWTVRRWYAGNEPKVILVDTGEPIALGQSVCVLEAPAG